MKQYIYIPRLALMFRKFWFEHWRALILLYLAIAALLCVWLNVYFFFGNPRLFKENFQVGYYSIGLLLSGCLTANFLFSELKNKPQAISFLLLPVSQLEKIICFLFFGVIVFWVGYACVFLAVDTLFVTMANIKNDTHWPIINLLRLKDYEDSLFDQIPSPYSYYFAFQALFILGTLYFKRYSFFKTTLIAMFVWVFLLFVPLIVFIPLGPGFFKDSMMSVEFFDLRGNKLVEMPQWFQMLTTIFFGYGIVLILWITTYYRLSEKEVD
jgi:hypothetical protein